MDTHLSILLSVSVVFSATDEQTMDTQELVVTDEVTGGVSRRMGFFDRLKILFGARVCSAICVQMRVETIIDHIDVDMWTQFDLPSSNDYMIRMKGNDGH